MKEAMVLKFKFHNFMFIMVEAHSCCFGQDISINYCGDNLALKGAHRWKDQYNLFFKISFCCFVKHGFIDPWSYFAMLICLHFCADLKGNVLSSMWGCTLSGQLNVAAPS